MTLPKGWPYNKRKSSGGASQKVRGSGTDGKIIAAVIVLCIVLVIIGVIVVLPLYGPIENIDKMLKPVKEQRLEAQNQRLEEEAQRLDAEAQRLELQKDNPQDGIYMTVLPISIVITAAGFFLCVWNYKESNHHRRYKLENEQKQHTFDIIFGFLASLAITTALTTYYDNFLALIATDLYSLIQPAPDQQPTNQQPTNQQRPDQLLYIIPNLHLIDFFVIAIPLTHAGYLFLSTLANEKEVTNRESNKDEKRNLNLHLRLVGAFVISVILIGLLFFLGGSIAISDEIIIGEESITKEPRLNLFQSNGFVFWLNLIVIGLIGWSLVIRKLIEESMKDKQQPKRIRAEWIWLDVFTLGFLISTSVIIFYLVLIDSPIELLYFNLSLSAVLVSRAVLNYYVGYNIYFPKPYQAKNESHTT